MCLSQKIYVEMIPPSEKDPRSDEHRLMDTLNQVLDQDVRLTLPALRQLSALTARGIWSVTVSISTDRHGEQICAAIEEGDTVQAHYGYAVDLGSTTVAVSLVSLSTGNVLASTSVYNRQIRFGEDILTRIFYCKDDPERLQQMQLAAVDSINEAFTVLKDETGIDPRQCIDAVIAGNTCMTHFLLGLDSFCVFSAPYAVHTDRGGFFPAETLGLPLPGNVYIYPCYANYIGGDTISGMISTEIMKRTDLSVFFDVGTNGELVVGCRDFLLCGAGAAGPALEGGSVITGMRAADGAVQGVQMHIHENAADFTLDVIGQGERCFSAETGSLTDDNTAAVIGICGSGIVDLIAQLFLHGWITIKGTFRPEASSRIRRRILPGTDQLQYAVEYAPGLWFYQQDIDELIRTKAAAWTMMDYMLARAGISPAEISRFYMCGAFGAHIRKESAVTIGMYPDVERSKILAAGNTSLDGCIRLLKDSTLLSEIEEILSLMSYTQFGAVDDFVERMHAAMALPHTDLQLFPSVQKKLLPDSD